MPIAQTIFLPFPTFRLADCMAALRFEFCCCQGNIPQINRLDTEYAFAAAVTVTASFDELPQVEAVCRPLTAMHPFLVGNTTARSP
jgi:hypothetical protein